MCSGVLKAVNTGTVVKDACVGYTVMTVLDEYERPERNIEGVQSVLGASTWPREFTPDEARVA